LPVPKPDAIRIPAIYIKKLLHLESNTAVSCSRKESCEMFPLISINSALKIWQKHYCDSKFESCQRFTLSLAGKAVPPTLLPNGRTILPKSETGEDTAQTPSTAAPEQVNKKTNQEFSYYFRIQSEDGSALEEKAAAILEELNIPADAAFKKSPAPSLQFLIYVTDQISDENAAEAFRRITKLAGSPSRVKAIKLESLTLQP